MTRHANASLAELSQSQGSRLAFVGRASAAFAASSGTTRNSAPKHTSNRAVALPLAALLALLAALAILPAAASADSRIGEGFKFSFPFNSHAGGLGYNLQGVAVGEEQGGDVFFLNGESLQRVDELHPDGTWARAFGFGIVPGAATGTGDLSAGSSTISNVTTSSGSFSEGGAGGKLITGAGIPPETTITSVGSNSLVLSKEATTSGSGVALSVAAGPGNVPTDEKQSVRVMATGGTFTLSFTSPNPGSSTIATNPLPYNASAAEVQSALNGLSNIGAGNISVTGGPGGETGEHPYVVSFEGRFADTNVRTLSAEGGSLSGGSPSSEASVTTPTQGGGVPEVCTTVCGFPSAEEESFEFSGESRPGSFNYSDEIAIDNDPASGSYGDVYVLDQRNFRIEKFSPTGEFLLMFGGEVDKTTGADVCTAADLAAGDTCGAGVPGTGPSHFYEGSYPKEWDQTGNNSIAVGPGGTVFVGDYGRIQEFKPDGTYIGQLTFTDPESQFVTSLAVDSSGDIFERSSTFGGENLTEIPGVREYSSSHVLLRTIDTATDSQPTHIAVDAAGDLVVSEPNSGETEFRVFKPNGALSAEFTSEEVHRSPAGIAINRATGLLYATTGEFEGAYVAVIPLPVPGPPSASEAEATNIEPTTATLKAVTDPHGYDTEVRFEYVDQKSFETEGGFGSPHTQSTAWEDLGIVDRQDKVHAAISGLTPATLYHFRVVAKNSEGTTYGAGEFESLPSISVRNFTTQTVGPELVVLRLELNPNGQASNYTIHIGRTTSYSDASLAGTLEVGNEFLSREVTFTGLNPNTTYHYQVEGENEYGRTETPDQTFTTERSSAEEREAEDCPNTNLREENNSLSLPDCRAYEQVSEVHKEGGQAFPDADLAPSGERVLYIANGAFAGAQTDELAVQYLAHRTESGWVSTAPVQRIPNSGYQPGLLENLSAELDRWTYPQEPGFNYQQKEPSSLFYSMGFVDGTLLPHASPTFTNLDGGSVQASVWGQSEDLSKQFIVTSSRLLASDPRPSGNSQHGDRIYELSGVGMPSQTLKLIAEEPLGLEGESCSLSGFLYGPGGSTGGNSTQMASSNGSTVVYAAPLETAPGKPCGGEGKPNQFGLFARVNGGPPIMINKPTPADCHAPSPCATSALSSPLYDGMSQDGSRIWFTTTQALVDSDTDESNDVYMAKLEHGEVVELVQASAGEATATHSTVGKGADVGETGINGYQNQGVARISKDGTHVAYESMEVLTEHPNALNQKAVPGANNLYVYDALTGKSQFVTELCSGVELSGSDRPNRSGPGLYYEVTKKNAVHDGACPRKSGGESEYFPFIGFAGPCSNNDDQMWLYECGGGEAVFSENGRYFFFTSWGRLTPDDHSNVKNLYRYDYQTGELIRLSFGRNGNDSNGNDERFPVSFESGRPAGNGKAFALAEDEERKVTSDGSQAIFMTAAPLASHDTNTGAKPTCEGGVQGTGCDVYMWEEQGHGTCTELGGCVSLISDGVAPHGAHSGIISSSGRDIIFETQRNLVPGDVDGVGDIYDARVDGGFPATHPPIHCSGGEACRGPQEPLPAPPPIGSETFSGTGNAATQLRCARGRRRVERHGQVRCIAQRHKKHMRHKKHSKKKYHRLSQGRAARRTLGGSK